MKHWTLSLSLTLSFSLLIMKQWTLSLSYDNRPILTENFSIPFTLSLLLSVCVSLSLSLSLSLFWLWNNELYPSTMVTDPFWQRTSIYLSERNIIDNLYKRNLVLKKIKNIICIPESFNTNIWHPLFDYTIIICKSTALEHKFKRWFFSQKPVLNVRFKDFWYTKINPTRIWYDKSN
jgi:hypothetical protein